MESKHERTPDDRSVTVAPAHRAAARSVLYEATRAVHEQLEATLSLASPGLALETYRAILPRFHAAHALLEGQIAPHAAALAGLGLIWDARCKLPLLNRDLEALGCVALPSLAPAAPLISLAEVLGCMYVLEGATLGGKRIARNLARVLRLGPETGAAFFHGYGDAAAASWRAFCVALERGLGDPPSRQQAAAAALRTFACFAACAVEPRSDDVGRTAHA